jgi:hypothetical protein
MTTSTIPLQRPAARQRLAALASTTAAAAELLSLGFATIGPRATLVAIAGQLLANARAT